MRYVFPIAVFVAYIAAGALLAIFKMDYFYLTDIRVEGARNTSRNEILRRAGLKQGYTSIFFSTGAARAKILENPRIVSIEFTKEFPSTLVVDIEEEVPFCLLRGAEGNLEYLSERGLRLGPATPDEGLDFPVLVSEDIFRPELVTNAIQALKLSRASNVLQWDEISEIHLDPLFGVRLLTRDMRRIDFGENHIRAKWRKVEDIITHSRSINLIEKYINIENGETGVVSYRF